MNLENKYQTVFVTGGCGFVGSSICLDLKRRYPEKEIVSFDNLKRLGSWLNVEKLKAEGVNFVHGDIRNKEDLPGSLANAVIIDASAEPSVMSGLEHSPLFVVNNNLLGSINLLEFARNTNSDFIFLSTSRVYSIEALNEIPYVEDETRYSYSDADFNGVDEKFSTRGHRSFYGTSKLATEMLLQEYSEYHGIKSVINRFGVIAGAGQFGKVDQGFVTLWLAAHYWKKNLKYIGFGGHGKQVRDVIDIRDVCDLIALQLTDLDNYNNGVFNIGGGLFNTSLLELTSICEVVTGNSIEITSISETRPADVRIYTTNNELIERKSGWTPKIAPSQCVESIFRWINHNERDLKDILG